MDIHVDIARTFESLFLAGPNVLCGEVEITVLEFGFVLCPTCERCSSQEGAEVSVRLKVGLMTCIEYCAMVGYEDMLQALIDSSVHHNTLSQYFSLAGEFSVSKKKNRSRRCGQVQMSQLCHEWFWHGTGTGKKASFVSLEPNEDTVYLRKSFRKSHVVEVV